MCQSKPTKEQVRSYMQRRVLQRTPPPDLMQIRRELGWNLVVAMDKGSRRSF